MPLTSKEIADSVELINNALDNIPVENKRNFVPIWEGLQDILQPGSGKTTKDKVIQEHLSDIADILNESTLGYTELENFPQFQQIIRQRITAKIQEFQGMTRSQQARYIRKQRQKAGKANYTKIKMAQTASDSKWITKQQMHNTGVEETEEQMLARRQLEFEAEGVPAIYFNNSDELNTLQEAGISLNQLAAINPTILAEFIEKSDIIARLINDVHISFEQLLAMDRRIRSEFIRYSKRLKALTTHGVSLTLLLTIEPAIRIKFLQRSNQFIKLINHGHISLDQLLEINPETRSEFLEYPDGLNMLITNGLSLTEIFVMKPEIRNEFLRHLNTTGILINHVNLAQLLGMDPIIRAQFFRQPYNIEQLFNTGISFDQLVQMNPTIRTQFLQYAYAVPMLILNENISFDQLVAMNPANRSTLLSNPWSPESTAVIAVIRAEATQEGVPLRRLKF